MFIPELWRPEVQNQGVGRAALPLEILEENLFFDSFNFRWLLAVLALGSHHSNLCHHLHMAFSPVYVCVCVCVCVCVLSLLLPLSHKATVKPFRVHPDNPGLSLHFNILNLIASAKTLFPNKVTFTGSWGWDLMSLEPPFSPLELVLINFTSTYEFG